MFLPTISDCIPSVEVWQAQWKARQQAKLESEAAAKKMKVGFEVLRPWIDHWLKEFGCFSNYLTWYRQDSRNKMLQIYLFKFIRFTLFTVS